MRIQDKKSLALVLSGGGVKAAAFHIGVCLALKEKGFRFAGGSPDHVKGLYPEDAMTFKTYVGSSAGAVVSSFLAAGHDVDSVVEAFLQGSEDEYSFKGRPSSNHVAQTLPPLTYRDIFSLNVKSSNPAKLLSRFIKRKPWISGGLEVLFKRGFKVNGLFTTKNIEEYLRKHCHPENTFDSLGVKLYIVATQLNHSRKVVFGQFQEPTKDEHLQYSNYATVSEAVAASAALPPFFAPYPIHDELGRDIYYFDGEIRDTLSTHVAVDHGADLVIASYSMKPYHYNEEIGSLHEFGMPVIFNQALYQVIEQKIRNNIKFHRNTRQLINAVDGYMREAQIAEEHREKLIEILISRTDYKPNVDYLYIHPVSEDYEFFFADHFSLNPNILSKIVRTGFKSAMQVLRKQGL